MTKIKNIINHGWIVFFVLYFVSVFIDSTTLFTRYPIVDSICLYLRYIIYLYFILRIVVNIKSIYRVLTKSTKLSVLLAIIVFLLVVALIVNYTITGNRRLLSLMVILLSSFDVDFDKLSINYVRLQIILTTLTVLLSCIGFLQNFTTTRGNLVRHSIGFTYPTNLSQMILFTELLFVYCYKEKIKYSDICLLELINLFAYFVTKTRTEFFLSQLIIIITIMLRTFSLFKLDYYKNIIKKFYSFVFITIYPLLPLGSLILVLDYRYSSKLIRLNGILSNRLSQTYYNVLVHGLKPFGSKISFAGWGIREQINKVMLGGAYVDSEYLQMVFKEGYIAAFLFVLVITVFLIMLYKLKKYDEILICSVYLLFGLVNPRIITLMYCPILFMIIPTVIEYNKSFTRRRLDEKV